MKYFEANGKKLPYEVVGPLRLTKSVRGKAKSIAYKVRLANEIVIGFLDKNQDLVCYESVGDFFGQLTH